MIRGRCLCGAVAFRTEAQPETTSVCHCGQCRRQSGHLWASGLVAKRDIVMTGEVTWYDSSDAAQRGFCAVCGTSLFWQAHDETTISFALGAVEEPTGLTLEKHIFVGSKGDYYDITDGLPQKE